MEKWTCRAFSRKKISRMKKYVYNREDEEKREKEGMFDDVTNENSIFRLYAFFLSIMKKLFRSMVFGLVYRRNKKEKLILTIVVIASLRKVSVVKSFSGVKRGWGLFWRGIERDGKIFVAKAFFPFREKTKAEERTLDSDEVHSKINYIRMTSAKISASFLTSNFALCLWNFFRVNFPFPSNFKAFFWPFI